MACINGAGDKLPLFWIQHERPTYKFNRAANERIQTKKGVAGLGLAQMLEWVESYKGDFPADSCLIMDRLASHLNEEVQEGLKEAGIQPLYLPTKGALLLSPLDNGFFGEFHNHYTTALAHHPEGQKDRKYYASTEAYDRVPDPHIQSFFAHCGLIGEETIPALRSRFGSQAGRLVDDQAEELTDLFEKWAIGLVELQDVNRLRRFTAERPVMLDDTNLDGRYWLHWGQHA